MQASERISVFVAATEYSNVPDTALRQAKASITDWLFVALAGQAQAGRPLQDLCEQLLGQVARPKSSLIGRPAKASENHAALINGYVGHVLDYDETCPKVRSHLFAPFSRPCWRPQRLAAFRADSCCWLRDRARSGHADGRSHHTVLDQGRLARHIAVRDLRGRRRLRQTDGSRRRPDSHGVRVGCIHGQRRGG